MNTEYFQKIEDYLFGNLSEADKQAFETEIANNETLATDVALQSLEHRAMKLAVRDDLRAQMSAWKQENLAAETTTQDAKIVQMPQPSAKVVPLNRRLFMWAAAASVLILAVFAGRQLLVPSRSSLEIAQGFYDDPSLASKGTDRKSVV